MTLLRDIARCQGGTEAAPCEYRGGCLRYLDRNTLGMWTPVHLRMCEAKENMIEAQKEVA